jgi:hypothetical protein
MEKCKTLGGESYFFFSIDEVKNELFIQTQGNDQVYIIPFGDIRISMTWDRINHSELPQREMAGNYNQPNWQLCPSPVLCPYIAKLLLHVIPNELIIIMVENNIPD